MKLSALSLPQFLIAVAAISFVGILKIVPWMASQSNAASFRRATQCQDNLMRISLALLQYQQDYNDYFPLASKQGTSGWSGALKHYGVGGVTIAADGSRRITAQCPEGKDNIGASTDYFLNSRVQGLAASRLRTPSWVITFGDGTDNAPPNATLSALPTSWVKDPSSPASRHVINNRHYANYAFADGHVKSIEPKHIGSTATGDNRYQTFAIR